MRSANKPRIRNRLRKYRKARGLRQRDVALLIGFTDSSHISRWERGLCLPTATNLFKLAAVYHCLVDALYIDFLRDVREDVRTMEHQVLSRRSP